MNVPIVLILDDNYMIPTATCITSILKNKNKTTNYDFILLTSCLSQNNKNLLNQIVKFHSGNTIVFFDVDKNKYKQYAAGWDCSVFLIFEIVNILYEYDKCLYLDGDTICQGDLQDLTQTNINNYYAGVVRNAAVSVLNPNRKWLYEEPSDYVGKQFNSGVILFNLKLMREHNLYSEFITQADWFNRNKKEPESYWGDQDVLNKVFLNKCLYLHLKYNFTFSTISGMDTPCYSQQEIEEAANNPIIIHYTTIYKPWKYKDAYIKYPPEKVKFHKVWENYFHSINPPIKMPSRLSVKVNKIFSIQNEKRRLRIYILGIKISIYKIWVKNY